MKRGKYIKRGYLCFRIEQTFDNYATSLTRKTKFGIEEEAVNTGPKETEEEKLKKQEQGNLFLHVNVLVYPTPLIGLHRNRRITKTTF